MALPNKHTELVVVSYHLRGQTLLIIFLDWQACLACAFDSNFIMYIHSINCKDSGYLEFQLAVQWERDDQKPVRLGHKVDFTGGQSTTLSST